MNNPRIRNTEPFETTYRGGRQERAWIRESLEELYRERWLTDILYRVKAGKEATVYCCRAGPGVGADLVAAKVFRPRMFRAMRNDALYKRGRQLLDPSAKTILDTRSLRALRAKSNYGRFLDTSAWVQHEYRALEELHEAGADVPRPVVSAPNAILMEYVGDEYQAAPILHAVRLGEEEAGVLYDHLLDNVEILLSCYRIHADLSAYNVLYWEGDVRIIDLPQTVDAIRHPQAYELFARDVDRLCRYFARQGLDVDPVGTAFDLWSRCIG